MGRRQKNYDDKLITSERAEELMEEGWRRADLHVHTTCSFDVLPARIYIQRVFMRKPLKWEWIILHLQITIP